MYQNNCMVTDDGFGIHTFELTIPSITKREFKRIRTSLKVKRIYTENYNRMIRIYPKKRGLRIWLNHTKDNFYNIKVVVSPRRLIDERSDAVSILRSDDNFELLRMVLNDVLEECLGEKYSMDSFTLSRIDCCVNIMLTESFSAQRYVKLIRRSMKYNDNAKIVKYPDDIPDSAQKNKHSFRIKTGDFTFTAYDKYFQLEDIGENFEKASEAFFRLEIAINRDKIRDMLVNIPNGISNLELLHVFTYSSREIFEEYINQHFFNGNYFYISDMRTLINKSGFTQKLKKLMLLYADMQCSKKTFTSAQKEFYMVPGNSGSIIKKMYNHFESIGVYPVSLSFRDKHGKKEVTGLYEMLGFKRRNKGGK